MRKLIITSIAIMAFIAIPFMTPAFAGDTTTNSGAGVIGVDNQAMSQGQGQSINDTANNSNVINFPESRDVTTTNNRGHGYRGFNNPAEINYPGMPSYFGPNTKNPNVQPAKVMTLFQKDFTRSEIEAYLKGTSVDHNRSGVGYEKTDKITVIFSPPDPSTVVQTALITTSAKNKDTESKDVLYSAILTGLDSGADLLLITAEGAGTILKSFGWGIGISYTRASINADETTGGVGAGGLGIAGAEAGYKSLPWIQAIGLKLK
jgi:hypothetical protein